MPQEPPPNNQKPNRRLGNRKTRTGCITCRKRKVKCSEERPLCQRCIVGNHHCEGYREPFILDQESIIITSFENAPSTTPRPMSTFPLLTPNETRALQYYFSNLVFHLGSPVSSSFWTNYVVQMSWQEPAVQLALVAVSGLCEQVKEDDSSYQGQIVSQTSSLQAYQKALAATAARVAAGDDDADIVALTTCVLFLCLEFLRRARDNALILLTRGARVLSRYLETCRQRHTPINPVIEGGLLPLFERMALQAAIFNQPMPAFRPLWSSSFRYTSGEEIYFDFDRICSARSVLYSLLADTYVLIRKLQPHSYGQDGPYVKWDKHPELMAQYLAGFDAWTSGAARLVEKLCKASSNNLLTRPQRNQVAVMRMYHAVGSAWLRAASGGVETSWDAEYEAFQTVVDQASSIILQSSALSSRSSSDDGDKTLHKRDHHSSKHFSFEMGVIPPLYLTAIKCRDPQLRAQALHVLRHAPQQEALFTRRDSVRVAERVIELEEKFLQLHAADQERMSKSPPNSVLDEAMLDATPEIALEKIAFAMIHTVGQEETRVTMLINSEQEGQIKVWRLWDETISDQGVVQTESALALEDVFRRSAQAQY